MLNKYFDKIYLINLDRRNDRMKECANDIKNNNIVLERFPAVEGRNLNLADYGITNPNHNKSDLGCLLSHRNLMIEVKKTNYKTILVLEDDFELCENFAERFEECMSQLPDDWQWLYFGGSHFEEPIKVTDNIYRVNKTLTSHAYAFKIEIADEIQNVLESNIENSVDTNMTFIQKKLNTYVTIPHLIYQRDGYSDIQNKNVSYVGIKNTIMDLGKK